MNYQSTRSNHLTATAAAAVLRGLAPDGGLFIAPLKEFDWQSVLELDTLGIVSDDLFRLLMNCSDTIGFVSVAGLTSVTVPSS